MIQLDPCHVRSEGIAPRQYKGDIQPLDIPAIVIGIGKSVGAASNHWPSLCRASGLAGSSLSNTHGEEAYGGRCTADYAESEECDLARFLSTTPCRGDSNILWHRNPTLADSA
jgi:hypothetical protein